MATGNSDIRASRRSSRALGRLAVSVTVALAGCATVSPMPDGSTARVLSPKQVATTLESADHMFEAGDFERAGILADLVLRAEAENAHAHRIAGASALATDALDTAALHLQRAHALAPDPETEGWLGIVHWRQGDAGAAEPFLLSALAQRPQGWREAFALADIAFRRGESDKALDFLSIAERGDGNAARIAELRGRVFTAAGRHAEALDALSRAAELSEGRLGQGIERRLALAGTGDVNAALRDADDADTARVYRHLGEIALDRGDKTAAVSHFRRSLAVAPRLDPQTQTLLDAALALPAAGG